jgi:hypothetical protein
MIALWRFHEIDADSLRSGRAAALFPERKALPDGVEEKCESDGTKLRLILDTKFLTDQ